MGNPIPCKSTNDYNRAGFNYQGEYWARDWARSIFGYDFEDENGFFGDPNTPPISHGLRRNHAVYGEELISWKRLSVQAGARYVHNESFGDYGVPRVAASYLLIRGGDVFSGTRLRGSFSEGIKEPNFLQTFGEAIFGIMGNPNLKPEQNNAFEAGVQQSFLKGKYSFDAVYFNNQFHDRIDTNATFTQYINIDKSMAQGAELTVQGRPRHACKCAEPMSTIDQILTGSTADRPRRFAEALRQRSGQLHAAEIRDDPGRSVHRTPAGLISLCFSCALLTTGRVMPGWMACTWYAIKRYVTAYANVENLLNERYEDALGYPALRANFRAGYEI